MKVARSAKTAKRGSNDYSDYDDNGVVKSLISCVGTGNSHTAVFGRIFYCKFSSINMEIGFCGGIDMCRTADSFG